MLDIDNRRVCFKVIDIFMNKLFFWKGHVNDNWLINDYMKTQKNVNDKPKGQTKIKCSITIYVYLVQS